MLKRLIYLCTGVSLACLLIWGVTTNLQAFVGESSRVVNSNGNTPKLIQITTASHVNRESRNPVINSDGTKIVFRSDSDLLGEGIGENQDEIWLYDGVSMTYTRITTASHSDRDSRRPAINGDGSKIVFESDSDLQGEGIGENQDQIWLYDTVTMAYIRITTSSHSGR